MEEMTETTDQSLTKKRPFSAEDWLYLLAFGLALLMRLAILGRGPLTEWEAEFSWQAYLVSQGGPVSFLSHPGYILPTGLLFYLFGSSELLARLLPALVGSAVVLFPYPFRGALGRKAALFAAFGLAFDPLMVAYARQAGSPAMAVGFVALLIFCHHKGKPFLTGLFAGLALLSGPSMIFGTLTLLAGWVLLVYVGGGSVSPSLEKDQWKLGAGGVATAVVVFGTLLMRYPQGLAAMFQAIPDYLAGMLNSDAAVHGVPVLQVLAAIPIYQPLALLFGLLWLTNRRSFQHPLTIFSLGSLLGALLLIALDPSRQIWMLLWVMVPLWFLAGQLIGPFLISPKRADQLIVFGEAVFFLVILLYWWFNLTKLTAIFVVNIPEGANFLAFSTLEPNTRVYIIRLLVTVVIPLLILLISAMATSLWEGKSPLQGTYLGVGVFLSLYVLMTAWNFTAQPKELAGELWVQGAASSSVSELMDAIEETSLQITGTRNELQLVYQIDSPLIHWLLRDFPNARYSPLPPENELPEAVLNRETGIENDLLAQFYRGEQIPFQLVKNWNDSPFPADFDRWLVYRESPLIKDQATLWQRSDLFPLSIPEPSE